MCALQFSTTLPERVLKIMAKKQLAGGTVVFLEDAWSAWDASLG